MDKNRVIQKLDPPPPETKPRATRWNWTCFSEIQGAIQKIAPYNQQDTRVTDKNRAHIFRINCLRRKFKEFESKGITGTVFMYSFVKHMCLSRSWISI